MVCGERSPSSGKRAMSAVAVTGPTPGAERSSRAMRSSSSRAAIRLATRFCTAAISVESQAMWRVMSAAISAGASCSRVRSCWRVATSWSRRLWSTARRCRSLAKAGAGGGLEAEAPRGGEHGSVERVGLGEKAGGAGEVAGACGIDPGKADAGLVQRLPQRQIVDAGGLEQNAFGLVVPLGDQGGDRRLGVGQADHPTAVKDIEVVLGDIDSNCTPGLATTGPCSCASKAVGAASVNCSGWVGRYAGGDRAELRGISRDREPNSISRPLQPCHKPEHTGTQEHGQPSRCSDAGGSLAGGGVHGFRVQRCALPRNDRNYPVIRSRRRSTRRANRLAPSGSAPSLKS